MHARPLVGSVKCLVYNNNATRACLVERTESRAATFSLLPLQVHTTITPDFSPEHLWSLQVRCAVIQSKKCIISSPEIQTNLVTISVLLVSRTSIQTVETVQPSPILDTAKIFLRAVLGYIIQP